METAALILWLAVQTPYAGAGSSQPYAPPPVRPFEPTEAFAATAPTGGPRTAPLAEPETLEAWRRGYQAGPEPLDAAYEQGVAVAEARADAMAGPLDGGWLVMEVGHYRPRVERAFPRLPFIWAETSGGDDCVLLIQREVLLSAARPARPSTPAAVPRRRKTSP